MISLYLREFLYVLRQEKGGSWEDTRRLRESWFKVVTLYRPYLRRSSRDGKGRRIRCQVGVLWTRKRRYTDKRDKVSGEGGRDGRGPIETG